MTALTILILMIWWVAQAKMDAMAENQRRENRLRDQRRS